MRLPTLLLTVTLTLLVGCAPKPSAHCANTMDPWMCEATRHDEWIIVIPVPENADPTTHYPVGV